MEEKSKNQTVNVRILTVKWKEYVIGYLMKEEGVGYLFKYDKKGMQEAKKASINAEGVPEFNYIIGFKNTNKTYVSTNLFPVFKSRIPTRQRRDLKEKLEEKQMSEYDEFEYLAKSKGKVKYDHISVEEGVQGLKVSVTSKKHGDSRPKKTITFVNSKTDDDIKGR